MKNYIDQYKTVFVLSWVILYLVYPIWIGKHLIFQAHGLQNLSYPLSRSLVILGLIIYFSISAYLMELSTRSVIVDQPALIKINDWASHMKDNLFFVIVCFLTVALHLYTFLLPFNLGEEPFVRRTLFLYDALSMRWHKVFDLPIQVFFWALALLITILVRQKKIVNLISHHAHELFSIIKRNYITKLLFITVIFVLFALYSSMFPYYSYYESLKIMRYPPLSKFLYVIMYSAFGTSLIVPRTIQFLFYILGAVYLYRTILLFRKKGAALLGAAIFLFSPIIFSFASQASLASGAIFFIILISYYFLRFLEYETNRDLMLTAFFIGTGFMYRGEMLIMFVACFAYLLFIRIKKSQLNKTMHFKILLLPLIIIIPYLQMGTPNPLVWSHLTSLEGLSIIGSMLYSQVSSIIFFLFLASFVFMVLKKRDNLSLFYGVIFIVYYVLFTLMEYGEYNHRYLMALYPTIAIFVAQLVSGIAEKIRWRYAFQSTFAVLMIYMVFLCLVPRSSTSLITYKYRDFETQYFPLEKATDWILDETEADAKILSLYMFPYESYLEWIYEKGVGKRKFIFYDPGNEAKNIVFPLQNLKEYCSREKISYIIFPFSPKNLYPSAETLLEKLKMTKYLNENLDSIFVKVAEFHFEDNFIFIYKVDLR